MAHILKYDTWQNGDNWYCGDINAIGQQGNQWYVPARLLGLSLDKYVAFLIAVFDANILGFNGKTLVYNFKTFSAADKFCKYINAKAEKFPILSN